MNVHRPCVLIILDGWGIAAPTRANAITTAKTPFFDSLVDRYPTAVLQASGEAAGLPWSEVGNSEVGHMSIGSGRIVYQDLSRINKSIADLSFFSNETILAAVHHARTKGSALHLIGNASTGGVHSHIEHLFALCEIARTSGLPNVFLHLFLDGRDAQYASGLGFIRSTLEHIAGTAIRIASLSGRQFAMDRDNHWERTEKAYRAIAEGSDQRSRDPVAAIEQSYALGVYDEEFIPTTIVDDKGPIGLVHDNDALIFFNIRSDRVRQISRCFFNGSFDRFQRQLPSGLSITTLTEYDPSNDASVAFPPQQIVNGLAECVSAQGKRQLHIAETEKYAHITYFLNTGREEMYPGEERVMIPSPHVDSYADKPEMSAVEITDGVLRAIEKEVYDLITINFANADMVGHTGNLKATQLAIETLDRCLKRIVPAVLSKGGCVCITADHGNAEELLDLHTGQIDKEHSNNPVPCIIIAPEVEGRSLNVQDVGNKDLHIVEAHGMLADVTPTLLPFMGIPQPVEMTGRDLLAML
ncbi:MAG: 2,3-bisphosphoglycerate-independent phosphoglycerate mutase [Patescibacteria group bacterium]